MAEKNIKRTLKDVTGVICLAAVYFFAGKFGLRMAFLNPSASAVWPPTGISLAMLTLLGMRFWPGVFIGAFLVNFTTAGTFVTSFGIAAGNTLEAVIGVWCLHRFAGGRQSFDKASNVFRYIVFVAMLSPMVSATFGVTTLCLGKLASWDHFAIIWLTWWLGDMVSDILIVPFLLIWATRTSFRPDWKRLLESVILLFLLVLAGLFVFSDWLHFGNRNYPLEYLTIPFLLWASFRLERRGAVTAAFLISGMAVWGTICGYGPFAAQNSNAALLLLQAFTAVIMCTVLILNAVLLEQKKAEKELKEYAQKLEYSNKELEQFAYVASHDLQEPLRGIIAFGDLVKRNQGKDPKNSADYVDRLQNAALRMKRLIEDLLDYSRVTTQTNTKDIVDLNAVVREVLQDMEVRVQELKAVIEVGLLPSVRANELQMKCLFQNLIGNALKFTKKGEAPRIRIQSRRSGDAWAVISIQDFGIGFEEKYLDRIFKPFQRLHNNKEYEGNGIGLAICQKVVYYCGGEISAQSRPGEGATFNISLPVGLAAGRERS